MGRPTSKPLAADAPPRPELLPLANEADGAEVFDCDVSKGPSKLFGKDPNATYDSRGLLGEDRSEHQTGQVLPASGERMPLPGIAPDNWGQLQEQPAGQAVPIDLPVQVDMLESEALPLQDKDLVARRNVVASSMCPSEDDEGRVSCIRESYPADSMRTAVEQQRQA